MECTFGETININSNKLFFCRKVSHSDQLALWTLCTSEYLLTISEKFLHTEWPKGLNKQT